MDKDCGRKCTNAGDQIEVSFNEDASLNRYWNSHSI